MLAFIERTATRDVARKVAESANRNILTWSEPDIGRRHEPSDRPHAGCIVSQAVRLMEDSIESPKTIPEIAKACRVSERELGRIFKRSTGLAPRQFFQRLRLEKARDLLRQSDFSVTEIAMMTGFNSLSRFTQAFSVYFDSPPSTVRSASTWLNINQLNPGNRGLLLTADDSHHAKFSGTDSDTRR